MHNKGTLTTMIKYFSLLLLVSFVLEASSITLTPTLSSIDIVFKGKKIKISRIQDSNHKMNKTFSLTSRLSPPFEIQPYTVVEGVETISELDVFQFMQNELQKEGLVIDTRLKHWFNQSTIPTAMNIPFTEMAEYNTTNGLKIFSVKNIKGELDFSKAKTLLIFDNGPWCPQASHAIKTLISLGYPKDKILYYRGGMQYWSILGLHYAYPKGEENGK
jgi:hypothetical protein